MDMYEERQQKDENTMKNVKNDEIKLLNNNDMNNKDEKTKLGAKKQMIITSMFIPFLTVLIIISTHSNYLITKPISIVLMILLGVCILIFTTGLFKYITNRKIKTLSKYKKWQRVMYKLFMTVYIIGCFGFIFILYGPYNGFRDWLVSTAMSTMNHQYLCKWFYNNEEIEEVFSRNYIDESGDSTDEDLIDVNGNNEDIVEYENEYEQAILEREKGSLYKIINFEVNECSAYLAVIYDPSKVSVTTTAYLGDRGQYVTTMAQRENAVVAINGGGFNDANYSSTGGLPTGITIVDGKIVTNNEYGSFASGGIIGFTNENKLVLLKDTSAHTAIEQGVRDAVSWGPFLIVNGKSAFISGNGGWGYAARTAIGQRSDGIVLLLVVDSNYNRTKGASMVDLTEIMENYGAINAANLDGGTSSVMAINGELINDPIDSTFTHKTRPIATSIIVTE